MTTSVKFIVSFVVLVFVSMSLYAKTITITRSGGGPNGFLNVNETHEDNPWPLADASTLDCTGSGYSACEWMYPPKISAIPQVEDEIDAGNYSGMLEFTHRGGEVSVVVWEGTGPYDVVIEETITLPDPVVE